MRRLAKCVVAVLAGFGLSIVAATSMASAAAPASVTITSTGCGGTLFCFKPPTLTVANGGSVEWMNSTAVPHTVTRCTPAACSGMGPGTGTDSTFTNASIGAHGTFTHTFHGAGTYNYYCAIHGYAVMHGSVTVKAPK